ncbi:MAG: hypothetical protein KDD55_09145, partial [Bdellovibrionales bacterium]|nr:hypothetical protein [Bdellovibrionales bacterium]
MQPAPSDNPVHVPALDLQSVDLPSHRACPLSQLAAPRRIRPEDILVVTKLSKVEYDIARFGVSEGEL